MMLASFYETKEDYEKAVEIVNQGLTKNENNIDLIFRLGVIADKRGDKESSIKYMRRVLEINSDHADSLNYIGYTYAEQGINLDEALTLIKKALELEPDKGHIIDSLGWVYFQKGLYDEALHHLKRSVELLPEDPTINEHLGDTYMKKEMHKEALEYFKKALALKDSEKVNLEKKISEIERLLRQGE